MSKNCPNFELAGELSQLTSKTLHKINYVRGRKKREHFLPEFIALPFRQTNHWTSKQKVTNAKRPKPVPLAEALFRGLTEEGKAWLMPGWQVGV